jgi:hypothetical protein
LKQQHALPKHQQARSLLLLLLLLKVRQAKLPQQFQNPCCQQPSQRVQLLLLLLLKFHRTKPQRQQRAHKVTKQAQ